MNSLVIFPEELIEDDCALLKGERVVHLITHHTPRPHSTIRVSLYGGKRGTGTICDISNDTAKIRLALDLDPIPNENIVAIVAIPRPQCQKRLIRDSAILGISELHFVRCQRTEKSYLSSQALTPESIRYHTIIGLEQAYNSLPPMICVHDRFRPFIEDFLPSKALFNSSVKLLCDTLSATPKQRSHITPTDTVMFAIGPEAGWNDYERDRFREAGFKPYSLGERLLRVDTAFISAIARICEARAAMTLE
ncbi:MAG: 16S rRNA (uracil(1498)-N(3))-methyltransferase [Candidatus Dadabacteria bacterium]|nr:MAG: 16S rRNA (uracil(1498)-N(3))-methyltransferase [Candidatus Dadabacteria bacterium]